MGSRVSLRWAVIALGAFLSAVVAVIGASFGLYASKFRNKAVYQRLAHEGHWVLLTAQHLNAVMVGAKVSEVKLVKEGEGWFVVKGDKKAPFLSPLEDEDGVIVFEPARVETLRGFYKESVREGLEPVRFWADGKAYLGVASQFGGRSVFWGVEEAKIRPPWTYYAGLAFLIISVLFFLELGLVLLYRRYSRFMREVTSSVWALASGNLSAAPEPWGFQEERTVLRHIARALENLRELVNKVKGVGTGVAASMEEASAVVDETTRALQDHQERISRASTALEEIAGSIAEVSAGVQEAAQAASDAERLSEEGGSAVDSIAAEASETKDSVRSLGERMEALERVSKEISSVIDLINEVAEETNILALNAAIEASRAGEAGRGFAAVAEEIGSLAERSLTESKRVRRSVEEVLKSLREAAEGTGEVVRRIESLTENIQGLRTTFHLIAGSVKDVAERMARVATAVEEQSATVSEVSGEVVELASSGQQIAAAATELRKAVEDVKKDLEELRDLLEQFRT